MRIEFGDDEAPEIGLIALIDCILFLLMFFMVATSFKHQGEGQSPQALPITLPTSAATLDRPRTGPGVLAIGIDARGGLYWSNEPVTQAQLRERLHAAAQRDPGQRVRIDGDTQAAYQHIVHVLDLCQFEGLTQISMRAREGR